MKIKYQNKSGARQIISCKKCKKEFETLKQNPEFIILFNEFQTKKSIIEDYIQELEKSSELTLNMKKYK